MLPSGAVVVAFTGTGAHLLFRTTLNTCDAFFRNAILLPNQKNANTSSARNNLKNRKIHYTDTKVDRPRRRQPQLGAEAGASQHTMRSCLVGCVHTALHHGGEAVAPCPAPTHLHGLGVRHGGSCTAFLVPHASSKDASVHLAASPAPLRRIIGFRALTQHERLTRLRYMEDVRGAICLETMGSSIHWKAATTISLPGDAVLDGPRRVRHHMLSTELLPGTLRAAAGWAYSSHGAPGTPWTVSDDRPLKRRTPLRDHVSGSAALPLDSPDSGAPCGPHRAASGSLA
ncbi:hypothetical protein TCDM_11786 [Trypanosoma cruzi Dm28c]|uniref:Uncharacterized protein n=1 Tax=Trypanosoma cruzi Dm28c TaxID=1416333 RepID=V5B3Y9_TRYCR|nr:hypothetical protein TCDM_11786 [Trypanosoma cruzi Dm28c]